MLLKKRKYIMPKRKRTGTSARTRPYKKSKTSRSGYTGLAVGPKTLTRKLRYVERINIDGGAASQATNVFYRANGCFDPTVAVGGHQPMGFDQYMAMYDHFKVKSSKLSCTFIASHTAAATSDVIATIYLDDDSTAVLSTNTMIEQGLTSWAVVASGDNPPVTLIKTFNSNDYFSSKKYSSEIVGDDAADPAEQAFYNISVSALKGGSDPDNVSALVVIDYVVEFSERKTLVAS